MRPKKKDRDLPACVYRKHGSHWLVQHNKWINLGPDLSRALAEYARRKMIGEGMPALLERWLDQATLAKKTRQSYGVAVRKLGTILAEFTADQVTAHDVRDIMRAYRDKPATANLLRTVMINALEFAIDERMVERNVARDTRPLGTARRDRYITDAEYAAIHGSASPTMVIIMDLCYLTGQRIGDILAMRYADINNDGINFRQQKTAHRMLVLWSDQLRETVERARALHQSVKGLTLIHSRQGTPLTYSTVRTLWDRACAKAGITDAHIHDIRAKAATDAKAQGLDSQALLGHTTESSHMRYLRSKETPTARPVSIRLSNK
jgi:integrase